jgi:hypothetical protein
LSSIKFIVSLKIYITRGCQENILSSTFLTIKGREIKATLWVHLIHVRMASIKNTNNNKCQWGSRGKKNPHALFVYIVQLLWKKLWKCLKKLKIELPYDLAIPISKEYKWGYNKDTCTPMLIAALFTIAKLWKQPRCPKTDKWIKKMWHLSAMGFYSVIKGVKFFCLQVNG